MNTFKNVIIGLFAMLASTVMIGQDIHFSQFYMSPLNLNPALTGVMNCNTRVVANYRNQWSQVLQGDAYNTYSVSYDQKIAVGRSDYFGVGGSFWGDRAGELSFGTTQGRLSFSYAKKMGGYRKKAHYLVFGADAGVTQRRVDLTGAQWPSQHDGNGGFSAGSGSPVLINDTDFLHGDLSAGVVFFSTLDDRNSYYVGLALHHLNQPNVTFQDQGTDNLTSRLTLHGGGEFELNKDISLVPGFVYLSQGEHKQLNLGTSFRFALGPKSAKQSWQIGTWFRLGTQEGGGIHSDAIIFSTRFDYGNYGIGFSYDATVSDLRQAASATGAFEFSLVYLICGPEKRSVYCPRF